GVERRLTTPADEPVDLLAIVDEHNTPPWQYLSTANGRLLLIRITPVPEPGALSPFDHAIGRIRAIMQEHRAAYPGVAFGLTGIDVIESDENVAVQRDTTYTSIGAAVAIALLLVAAFHSVRLPLMMMTALGVGIAWA